MSIHTIFLNFKFGTINQIVTAKPNQTDVVIRDGTNITFLKYNFHKEMQTHNELLQIRYHKFQWSWDSKWIIRSLSLQRSPAICIFCRCPGPILCIASHGIVASVWAAVFTPRITTSLAAQSFIRAEISQHSRGRVASWPALRLAQCPCEEAADGRPQTLIVTSSSHPARVGILAAWSGIPSSFFSALFRPRCGAGRSPAGSAAAAWSASRNCWAWQ